MVNKWVTILPGMLFIEEKITKNPKFNDIVKATPHVILVLPLVSVCSWVTLEVLNMEDLDSFSPVPV